MNNQNIRQRMDQVLRITRLDKIGILAAIINFIGSDAYSIATAEPNKGAAARRVPGTEAKTIEHEMCGKGKAVNGIEADYLGDGECKILVACPNGDVRMLGYKDRD